ncbi:pyridoxal-phosphate dependent enzyme [Frateuria sp.]|uniref:threonine ammonia-lyase n=1 Tax=Frateuria sp. TaxID=2211372 RepID=UPI0017C42F6A|nr:pyridoxal-phosphate dependent enzyme [Frateuria sp.]NUR22238.1 pyridoxal-phosphate dependent enzyme [Frateuria sp.]
MDSLPRFDRILQASGHIDPVFLDSPQASDDALDARLGCPLLAKIEFANPIGSFKGRGADVFCATALAPAEAVCCASAGNFGQGLARAAARLGHACTVFAAHGANEVKVEAMRRLGAQIRLHGHDFDAAKDAARTHAAEHGLRYVEDGAEAAIAEGAGTIALELLRDGDFDAVVVPVGNGALLAGIGTVLRRLAPAVEIVAAVAAGAPAMKLSIDAERVVATARADTVADGIAVRVPIASTLAHLRSCCDATVAVSESQILDAMRLIHRHLGHCVEPSGAVGVAAVLAQPARYAGRRVATVLTGANLSQPMRERLLAG